jgi:hypothetical protein
MITAFSRVIASSREVRKSILRRAAESRAADNCGRGARSGGGAETWNLAANRGPGMLPMINHPGRPSGALRAGIFSTMLGMMNRQGHHG